MTNRVELFGLPIDRINLTDTIEEVAKIISARVPIQHCVLNANKVNLVQRDPTLRKIIRDCGIVQADGVSIVWAASLLGLGKIPRVPGIDLMMHLLKEADEKNYRVFFLGAQKEVLLDLISIVTRDFPDVVIAGFHDGFFSESESVSVVKKISSSQSDILFVALPSPRKEFWLAENMGQLNVPFSMGVGGSFDVLAGKTRRAPLWMQRVGLEWFYRMIQEPIRLGPRYLSQNFIFGGIVLRAWISHWLAPQK